MKKPHYSCSPANYAKALTRIQNAIRTGRFARYTQQKKWQIWNRLCRYARQLGIRLKAPLAISCLTAGFCVATPAVAQQTFALQSGSNNPLNSVNVGSYSKPNFVDIDGDGKIDAFIGGQNGRIRFYKNTGTPSSPVFQLQTGVADPLNAINVGVSSAPVFVDIDGDGDKDLFVGSYIGTIQYFKNIGSATIPNFQEQLGTNNPLNSVRTVSFYYSTPAFVDIDGDGDMDVFVGFDSGAIRYFENTGSASAPVFVERTGSNNPLNGITGSYLAPSFVDIDRDGDKDLFIGLNNASIIYYKNTGTPTAPIFSLQTGSANPFNGINFGSKVAPAFADIDNDGDMDVFVGNSSGVIINYQNTSALLPLKLLGFNGSSQPGYNQLQWQTSGEVNTKWFEIERSTDGINFTKITTINNTGNSNNNYSLQDKGLNSNKIFYRLKMVDMDGRFTYSQVIFINGDQKSGITIYPTIAIDVININIGSGNLLNTEAALF
ncbi:MAG: VCBS repeat-containing protein, partial [Ginsengibacter sp.]